MPDYSNGKIYIIRSPQTDKVYIGSTTVGLSQRMAHHKNAAKNICHTKSSELFELGDAYIELLEEFPCENKEQLNAREGHYQRLYRDQIVNRCIAGRTDKERYELNRDERLDKQKVYRQNNLEKIKEYGKKWRAANPVYMKEYRATRNQQNDRPDLFELNGASHPPPFSCGTDEALHD